MQQHNTAAESCLSQQNIFLSSLWDEGEQQAICQINYSKYKQSMKTTQAIVLRPNLTSKLVWLSFRPAV